MSANQALEERVAQLEKQVEALTAEIDRNDDWASGLFRVLVDVLPHLLRSNPALAADLGRRWKKEAEQYDALQEDQGQAEDFHDTAEKAEATKMLYRMFDQVGLWPRHAGR